MDIKAKRIALLPLVCAATAVLHAQFTLVGRPVHIHGFASQGFTYSNDNNYLTMRTSEGSLAFTDGGVNMSASITDKLRVGAQLYVRNIGTLGHWHPVLDWAAADYKFKDWFGVRAGRVKTTLGLYTDTQDMEFLHTWAILPQSLYPLDLRAVTISHLGGDMYGDIPLPKHLGSLSYTAYAGRSPEDKYGGFRDVSLQQGRDRTGGSSWIAGGDLRWINPAPGLTVGVSWTHESGVGEGIVLARRTPYTFAKENHTSTFSSVRLMPDSSRTSASLINSCGRFCFAAI